MQPGDPNPSVSDLYTTVLHEIDEVLGIGGDGSTLTADQPLPTTGIGPLDLYRYQSPGQRSFSTSPNVPAYFSINRGTNYIALFSQYPGHDFGDWGNNVVPANGLPGNPPGVQDADASLGQTIYLGFREMVALDVVGYTVPLNPTTRFAQYTADTFTFSIFSLPGLLYQLQTISDLASGLWRNVGPPLMATDITLDFTDTNTTSRQQFYRVAILSPTNTPLVRVENPPTALEPSAPVDPPASVRRYITWGW